MLGLTLGINRMYGAFMTKIRFMLFGETVDIYSGGVKADFANKVSGSVVENPNTIKNINADTDILAIPSSPLWNEYTTQDTSKVALLDGTTLLRFKTISGGTQQNLFSFNIVSIYERKWGVIPSTTQSLADKVAWLKLNVTSLDCKWYGYGSCPSGNKAYLKVWVGLTSVYSTMTASNTASSVTLMKPYIDINFPTNYITTDGFIHVLAYTDPSNGTIASTIYTDYCSLDITLKPSYKSVGEQATDAYEGGVKSDFVGKIAGSFVENPNIFEDSWLTSNTLVPPSNTQFHEQVQSGYTSIQSLGGSSHITNTAQQDKIAAQLFSFDVVSEYERNYGIIPSATQSLADKIAWMKLNSLALQVNWTGYGSCPTGYKAQYQWWMGSTWSGTLRVHAYSVPTLASLVIAGANIPLSIDANGFTHFLAYTDPSDGITPSTIFTDYVSLDITMKPLYTYVDVLSRSKNLFGGYYGAKKIVDLVNNPSKAWLTVIDGRNVLALNGAIKDIPFLFKANIRYTLSCYNKRENINTGGLFSFSNDNNVLTWGGGTGSTEWTKFIMISNNTSGSIKSFGVTYGTAGGSCYYDYDTLQLEEGTVATPYTPFAEDSRILTLASPLKRISPTVADKYVDGRVTRNVSEWVELGGDLDWLHYTNLTGFKTLRIQKVFNGISNSEYTIKYDGKPLPNALKNNAVYDIDETQLLSGVVTLTVSNVESGFYGSYLATNAEVKAYFYGWVMCKSDGSAWDGVATKYWKSVVDGTGITAILPTSQVANYTPYKMLYQLATPIIETVATTPITRFTPGSLTVDAGTVAPTVIGG